MGSSPHRNSETIGYLCLRPNSLHADNNMRMRRTGTAAASRGYRTLFVFL